jgi:hypothetical protein
LTRLKKKNEQFLSLPPKPVCLPHYVCFFSPRCLLVTTPWSRGGKVLNSALVHLGGVHAHENIFNRNLHAEVQNFFF